jgi:vacuolar-type H+-ATPase subunit I/STV1
MREFACFTKAREDYEKSSRELEKLYDDDRARHRTQYKYKYDAMFAEVESLSKNFAQVSNQIVELQRENGILKMRIAKALELLEDCDESRYDIEQELLGTNEDEIIPIIDENDFDYYKTKKEVE